MQSGHYKSCPETGVARKQERQTPVMSRYLKYVWKMICCSHAAKSPAFHKIHLHDRNGTNTATFCACERAVYNLSSVHLRVGTNQYVWTKPCRAIAPCCTPAGSSHSVYSSGISLSSPLCINQAAGRLRNMTNTLARISPAVKTQGGRGILN